MWRSWPSSFSDRVFVVYLDWYITRECARGNSKALEVVTMMRHKRARYGVFRRMYKEQEAVFCKALEEAKKSLSEIRHAHRRDASLRVVYVDGRVKSADSIISKACEEDIPVDRVFQEVGDIVGLRVVVNGVRDVAPLIREIERRPRFEVLHREKHEADGGYRATHLQVSYVLPDGNQTRKVVCEVQIRTLLQDAWAVMTHHDVYKNQANLPALARLVSKHLSNALQTLDRLANDFRKAIEEEVEPPNDLSDDAPLDRQGIAFLYYELLGRKPQEYETEYLHRVANEVGVKSVGQARTGLRKEVFERLQKIHDKYFPWLPLGHELLEYEIRFAAQGPSVFREYRRTAERQWQEIESVARGEVLAELPETFDEFVMTVKTGDIPWNAVRELGGISTCTRCGIDIFVPDRAAEGVLDHYGFPDTDVDLEGLLDDVSDDAPCEPESVNTPGLCPWCDHMTSKDE